MAELSKTERAILEREKRTREAANPEPEKPKRRKKADDGDPEGR